jgi:c(7)-type cytochrome triheme protein
MNAKGITALGASVAGLCAAAWLVASPVLAQGGGGKAIYDVKCAACHKTGLLGSPKEGVAGDWTARLAQGRETLVANAINGVRQMPPRGGNPGLSDADVASAVDYLLSLLPAGQAAATPAGGGAADEAAKTAGAPAQQVAAAQPPPEPKAAAAPKPKTAPAPVPKTRRVPVRQKPASGANAFNRLMKPPSQRNPPPAKDGIHDPGNEGTHVLQSPRDAFGNLPKAPSGNRVDWVAALEDSRIAPRYDRLDPDAKPVIMDLNIVREVKGSMPNVVYPHKQHTEWLDCSNCHPAIFLPQKGANQISMAGILLGKQCGVCHGKVAFPVSECRRCHSGSKDAAASQ